MLWFEGIHWNTPIRDIGWTYVILVCLIALLIYFFVRLIKGEK